MDPPRMTQSSLAEHHLSGAAETPPKHTVGVVVCTYTVERWNLLKEAIDSVLGQSRPPEEFVLVIDNNPPMTRMATAEFPQVRVIDSVGRGLSDARNTGAQVLSSDIVAFLDDDAVADDNWLEA